MLKPAGRLLPDWLQVATIPAGLSVLAGRMHTDLILRHIARFISLDQTEADFFVAQLQSRKIARRDLLLRPGDICRYETFLVSGCVRVYSVDEAGTEHILLLGIEDWWVADLHSFLTQTPARYFMEALEDTEVLQISHERLETLYERVPKFERFFRILLQRAFIAQEARIQGNLSQTAEERYLAFRQRYPQLEQRLAQKHIAAYLGITPVFLSMLRRRLAAGNSSTT